MPASELVLEPIERRMSDRDFALVVFGLALPVAAVTGALVLLPRGFGILLAIVFAYPVIRIGRGAWSAHRATPPRVAITATHLDAGGLRFAWRDVTDVAVGPSARVRDRRDRVKVRLNRLAPVRPTDAAIRDAGLELGDQYFDFAIPPGYSVGAAEVAAAIEGRRAEARRSLATG